MSEFFCKIIFILQMQVNKSQNVIKARKMTKFSFTERLEFIVKNTLGINIYYHISPKYLYKAQFLNTVQSSKKLKT